MDDSPYPPQQAQPTRPSWLMPLLIAAAVLVVLAGVTTAWALTRAAPTPASAAKPTAVRTTAPYVVPVVESYTPTAADFQITIKTTKKTCFGSAGCNVEYHIAVGYSGMTLSTSDTFLVTYSVSGVEDGPQVNSFEITGEEYSAQDKEFAGTSGKSAKLVAKVLSVEKRG